jgi:hypothetical protein
MVVTAASTAAMNSTPTCGVKPSIYSSGSSHDQALKLLDEFLQQHSERAITDPLKRAFVSTRPCGSL